MANGQLGTVLRYLRQLVGTTEMGDRTDGQLLDSFAGCHEAAAFEALVHRHAPLVWNACRRILRDEHEAEDVFQATFLVLVKKAPTLDRRGSLGNWLYTVAYHLALKARIKAARQRTQEKAAADMVQSNPPSDYPDELHAVLDEELHRLPAKYRGPLVLCYLQGKTNEEAARELGCPPGSMSRHLDRGRDLLRERLARRGVALTTALLVPALADGASAVVPPAIIQATIQAGLVYAGGLAVASVLSVEAVALAEGWLKAAVAVKFRVAAVVLLTVGALGTGAGVLAYRSVAPRNSPVTPVETQTVTDESVAAWPPPTPRMIARHQPAPNGGRVVLYSRSRHGNYPLASYSFHRGLRGDDASVGNDVNLVFGNARREEALPKPRIDQVPGVAGHGAVGMEGFDPANRDEFRVTCLGGSQHRIVDLGKADYVGLLAVPKELKAVADNAEADTIPVKAGHVYAIRLLDSENELLREPRYLKLKILQHRDNDAVLFIWAPLSPRKPR